MARRKKPENETLEQAAVRQKLEAVANAANRSEKVSWERKCAALTDLLEKQIKPIEEQILDLMSKKQPLMDELATMRAELVHQCVHPFDYLVYKEDHIECKFCNRKISVQ